MTDKDAIIAQLLEDIKMLRAEIAMLKEKVAKLEKNSSNSSKPPSSDIVKPPKPEPVDGTKRKIGGQQGHQKFVRQPFKPEDITDTIICELSAQESKGLEVLDEWCIVQQIKLPYKIYEVIEYQARMYRDPHTGKKFHAPLPQGVGEGGLLGPDITALVAFLKGACHASYTTIEQFFEQVLRLDISRGLLCKATQKVSDALAGCHKQLRERLPKEPQIGVDETGHHNNGDLYWTWCFQTRAYSVFCIDQSRGSKVLTAVLGNDFTGIIGCDYWGAYRKYARLFDVRMQYCLAHLIREIRFIAEQKCPKLAQWAQHLLDWLKKLFKTLHRKDDYTPQSFLWQMKQIKEHFLAIVRHLPDHKLAKKLARRFDGDRAEDYFRFMDEPAVEPTNNGTERDVRHTVIDRRVTQGTRGDAGMRWCERIWTTIATCKKQGRNVFDFIHQSILAHWTKQPYPQLL
jgi:transposase